MTREMKDSGVAWIGKIPTGWTIRRLQWCLAEVIEKNDPIRTTQILSLTNKQGVLPYEDKGAQGNKAKENISEYKIAYENTLIVNSMNVIIGSVGISHYFGCVSPVYYVFKETTESDLRFINYIFSTVGFQKECRKFAKGILEIRLRISSSDLFKRPIPLPNIDEQRRIADYLDTECAKMDAILEKTYVSIEEYKKLKQAIITQVVTKGIRGDRPMKESGIEWVPMIPADWSNYRGKHLFYETNERSETGSEELLTVSHKTGVTPRSQKNVNMFMSESLVGYKICRKGDIAANTMWMWQGAIGVSSYRGVISPSYNTYRQRKGAFDSQYLDYLLRVPPLVELYNVCSTGITASRLRLYPEQFLSIQFIVPPMEEQQEIVRFLHSRVDEMDALIQKKEQFLAELETYKKSLIYNYVTGKKEV